MTVVSSLGSSQKHFSLHEHAANVALQLWQIGDLFLPPIVVGSVQFSRRGKFPELKDVAGRAALTNMADVDMTDVEYEVVEVALTPQQAEQVKQIPGVICEPIPPLEFKNPHLTPKQRRLAAEKEKERIWQAFLTWQEKSRMSYDEANVKQWVEQQVFNDCVQRGDWCPRCGKWTRGTVGCGTAGCTLGEYQMDYHICNIVGCTHYLHDKQESSPDGIRRCFEHHLV